jgi:hypothetical protein
VRGRLNGDGVDHAAARANGRFRHQLAEMALKHEAARCLTYHAPRLLAAGHDALREVTKAKLHSQRAAFEVADAGFLMAGRRPRDRRARCGTTRLGPIGSGTDQVMKEILGKQLGSRAASAGHHNFHAVTGGALRRQKARDNAADAAAGARPVPADAGRCAWV